MNKWLEILAGLILVIAAITGSILMPNWGKAAIEFLRGGIVWFIAGVGFLFLVLGISDLKN